MFVPPKKNHTLGIDPKKAQTQPTSKASASSTVVNEEKEDSKWNILDSCCFAPYKVLFAPATMVVKAVANKVK